MAKAKEAYHKRDLYSDGAVMTLARYHARETIKRELKAQGIKLASVESCEITRALTDTSTTIPRSSPSLLKSTAVSLQVANCDLQGEICTTEEALSCKGFRCANIVNEMNETLGHERPKEIPCMMEAKNDRRLCPS